MVTYLGSPVKANNKLYNNQYVTNSSDTNANAKDAMQMNNILKTKNKFSEEEPTGNVFGKQLNAVTNKQNSILDNYSKKELQYYEFLCRVSEIKLWIESVLETSIPEEISLCCGDALRNGVILATITQKINPELAPSIFPAGSNLQYKHTQNINCFLSLVKHVGVPESFCFELQDLYNKKNLPQVIETLYILISLINKKWPGKTPELVSVSGTKIFAKEQIRQCERTWGRIRDFKSLAKNARKSSTQSNKENKPPLKSALINDFNHYATIQPLISPADLMKTPEKNIRQLDTDGMKGLVNSIDRDVKKTLLFNEGTDSSTINLTDNQIKATPKLPYSPLRASAFSYLSPSISKYVSHDSDYYQRRSQIRNEELQFYQTYSYSPSHYSPSRNHKLSDEEFLERVISFQGTVRGSMLRFNQYMHKKLLYLFEEDIKSLQGCVKSLRMKSQYKYMRMSVNHDKYPELLKIQAVLKGNKQREVFDKRLISYSRRKHFILQIQSKGRGLRIRRALIEKLQTISSFEFTIKHLQNVVLGYKTRIETGFSLISSTEYIDRISKLQGHLRAIEYRKNKMSIIVNTVKKNVLVLLPLQALTKGVLVRLDIRKNIDSLSHNPTTINVIIGTFKGIIMRRALTSLQECESHQYLLVVKLQSVVRGILVRYTLDLVDDIVEVNNVQNLRSVVKGYILRRTLFHMRAYYKRNETSVICLQSQIRMTLQRRAYVDLISSPNPTLKSIKRFAYLMNSSGIIETMQNKLESNQALLDSENMLKEKFQTQLREQLDIVEVLSNFNLNSKTRTDLKNIDSAVPRSKYPLHEKLFYLLQVNPAYWKSIFKVDPYFTMENAYVAFTTINQKMGKRERIYFTKLVSDLMHYELNKSDSLTVFLQNKGAGWRSLLSNFLHKEYPDLFDLFQPLLVHLSNRSLNFETDPQKIFKSLYKTDPSSSSTAIEDPQTREHFIKALRNIWNAVEQIAEVFTKNVEAIPIEIRFISSKLFSLVADKNGSEIDSLRAVAATILQVFVSEFVEGREKYYYEDTYILNDRIKVTMKSLWCVFGFYDFDGFMEPLNQYSSEIRPHVKTLLYNLLIGPEYEQTSEVMIYEDMSNSAPQLEVLTSKVQQITSVFQENAEEFAETDVIHEVLNELESENALSQNGRILLELNPSVFRFSASDDRLKRVYEQVKRAFVYMMQVEDVDSNLYDLSMSSILPDDEPTFQKLLKEFEGVNKDPLIFALEPLNYFNLKNVTLKNIKQLKSAHVILPSANNFQIFLNDIANTIKNPDYAIENVSKELQLTQRTVDKLKRLNKELESNLKSYRNSINQTLIEIQDAHNFSHTHRSTISNIKHAYKKVSGKENDANKGLTFKWTAKQLYEGGVLKNIRGETLGKQSVKVFGASGPNFPDIHFRIFTTNGSKFGIKLQDKRKGLERKLADKIDSFDFKDLIMAQVGTRVKTWNLFSNGVTIDTKMLLTLVINHFFHRVLT